MITYWKQLSLEPSTLKAVSPCTFHSETSFLLNLPLWKQFPLESSTLKPVSPWTFHSESSFPLNLPLCKQLPLEPSTLKAVSPEPSTLKAASPCTFHSESSFPLHIPLWKQFRSIDSVIIECVTNSATDARLAWHKLSLPTVIEDVLWYFYTPSLASIHSTYSLYALWLYTET